MSAVPTIYAHHRPLPLLGIGTRLIAGCLAAACLAVLVLAATLRADPSGVGTHLQLGMRPCGMLATSGVPCPTCGMTTSVAHLAHGRLLSSLIAQPAGTLFGFAAALGVWAGGYVAATGRPSARLLNRVPIGPAFVTVAVVACLGWAYKIAVVVNASR